MKNDQLSNHFRARVHYRSVETTKVRVAYREAGPAGAPVIVLLHGFPTSSHMFRDLIPLLADRYRLIAPDYPGFGYSATPPPDTFEYTFDHLADVMEAFVDALASGAMRSICKTSAARSDSGWQRAGRNPLRRSSSRMPMRTTRA